MQLLKNSVIEVAENHYFSSGKYRLLEIFIEDKAICLYELDSKNASTKPKIVKISHYLELVDLSLVTALDDIIPPEMVLTDAQLGENKIKKRARAYSFISKLVEDSSFLKAYASTGRSNIVVNQ